MQLHMSVKPSLVTQLSQKMVLTPQLRQRIEMLQMTKLELSDLVMQQLGENPVLDEVLPEETSVAPELASDDPPDQAAALTNGAAEMPAEASAGETIPGETQREAVSGTVETEPPSTGELPAPSATSE